MNRAEQDREDMREMRKLAIERAREIRQDLMRRQEIREERGFQRERDAQQAATLADTVTDASGRVYGVRRSGEAFNLGITAPEKDSPAPRTREVKRGDALVTEEWDQAARTWREIGTAPRTERAASYADFLIPLAKKLAGGGDLSKGEQRAVDLLQRTDVLDQLINRAMSGTGLSGPPASSSSTTPDDAGDEQIIREARDAIARGADRNAVRRRLRELGVDPAGL
jgi:hypothetical protein